MYNIDIYTDGLNRVTLAVSGCEAAYAAFRAACEVAMLTGARVDLWDGNTDEVLASSEDE